MIKFHDVKTTDRELIQSYTLCGDRMNCDLSFANIISWRFLYNTQIAEVDGLFSVPFFIRDIILPIWLQCGNCKWDEAMRERFAAVIKQMRDDAITLGHPFLMLGVCSYMVSVLEETFPDTFLYKSPIATILITSTPVKSWQHCLVRNFKANEIIVISSVRAILTMSIVHLQRR